MNNKKKIDFDYSELIIMFNKFDIVGLLGFEMIIDFSKNDYDLEDLINAIEAIYTEKYNELDEYRKSLLKKFASQPTHIIKNIIDLNEKEKELLYILACNSLIRVEENKVLCAEEDVQMEFFELIHSLSEESIRIIINPEKGNQKKKK